MRFTIFFFVAAVFFVHGASAALAYNPSINVPPLPYEVYMADSDITVEAEYLGELVGDPHMYEFSIGAETPLRLTLFQLEATEVVPFSLIAVKQNNQNAGVVEVGRLAAKDITWTKADDNGLGLDLVASQTFEATISPGIYRVEVSTSENYGKYMLRIGEIDANPGYFSTLADVRMIQKFFGASIFSLFLSSYVYYPLGIVILIILIFMTWRKREQLSAKKYA